MVAVGLTQASMVCSGALPEKAPMLATETLCLFPVKCRAVWEPATGMSSTGLTVRVNEVCTWRLSPSVTVTVTVATPLALAMGLSRSERVPPLPVALKFPRSCGLLWDAWTDSELPAVSRSPTLKLTVTLPSSSMVWSAMLPTVGGEETTWITGCPAATLAFTVADSMTN